MTNPDRRAAISAKLWEIAKQHIIAEWICCEPLEPDHTLCAKGCAALGMVKTLLVDSPEAWNPAAPLLDAIMGMLPETDNVQDTLPEWLYQRFGCTGQLPQRPAWSELDDGDQSYWQHQAEAVRRAVARGGFKEKRP